MEKLLISCDLDETLLTTNKKISLLSKLYIRWFCKKGNIFVINTGRAYQSATRFYKDLKLKNMPIVAGNGSTIVYLDKDYNVKESIELYFNKETLLDILNDFEPYVLGCNIGDLNNHIVLDGGYVPTWIDWTKAKINIMRVKNIKEHIPEKPLIANIYIKEMNVDEINSKMSKYNDIEYRLWHVHDDIYSFEIFNTGVGKGNAMLFLANKHGVKFENVFAFGDQTNDIDMIKKAKYGIAMKNACKPLKDIAKYHTCYDNNHSGVVRYMLKKQYKK